MPDPLRPLRLGVNIDHVATLRNARGGTHPDPVAAALAAQAAGADGITAHLREDRRHIRDADVERLQAALQVPLNLETAATVEMARIASALRPHACCLVPERRLEVTTEGGLNVRGGGPPLAETMAALTAAGIRVSMFIDPDPDQVSASAEIGAPVIELHTGRYCDTRGEDRAAELGRLQRAATQAAALGLEVHAGHGLSTDNVGPVAAIPEVVELNIGHALIGDAVFSGLERAIAGMRAAMTAGRQGAAA